MAKDLFNRYIWLVDTIYRTSKITLEDINQKWVRNSMSGGNPIPNRTFHNHRNAIEEMFDINIECNSSTYEYYIDNAEDMENGGVRRWLLNTFAVNNLINESHKLKNRILFENIPSGQQFLTPIIEAMRDGLKLEMTYQSYGRDSAASYPFEPYFVKVFKQRWYVIGRSDKVRIHALDRIQQLVITEQKFDLPSNVVPETYFANCFGIIHDESVPSQTVQLKITSWQANYLRALPLHHSQNEVQRSDDFSVFEFFLKPTFDFMQEILSLGDDVELILPLTLRDKLRNEIKKMNSYYDQ